MRRHRLAASIAALLAVLAGLTFPALAPTSAHATTPIHTSGYGRLMLLLDSSGSMAERAGDGRTKIRDAKLALDQVVTGLPSGAFVGLRVFGSTVFSKSQPGACSDTQLVVPPGTGNRGKLRGAVASYKPYGETPIPAALRAAASDLGDEGKRSIVLVSDGESTCGNPCPTARDIANSGIDVQIDVVGLDVTGAARRELQCIASSGHGTYYDAHNARDLTRSIGRSSLRAAQPFTIEGQPVTGSTTQSSAPTISAGTWLDHTPAVGEKRYYYIKRAIAGSTLTVGMAVKPSASSSAGYSLELRTTGGANCGFGDNTKLFDNDTGPVLLSAQSHWAGADHACGTAAGLVLEVGNISTGKADPPAPAQIVVNEEPPATNATSLPPAATEGDDVWHAVPRAGKVSSTTFGTSFSTAPELGDGIFRTSIVPGEVQLYKVPLAWGQALEAEARVAPVQAGRGSAYDGSALDVAIIGPGLDTATDEFPVEPNGAKVPYVGQATLSSTAPSVVRAMTFPVRYNNLDGSYGEIQGASYAGDYYVMVSFLPSVYKASYIAPYDLAIKRIGTAGTGTPTYRNEKVTTTAPPTTTASSGPSASAQPTDSTHATTAKTSNVASNVQHGSDVKKPLAFGLGALGVVLLVVAGLLVRRRVP